jgi:hypothetical protein
MCSIVRTSERFYEDSERWAIVEDRRYPGPMLVSKRELSREEIFAAFLAMRKLCEKLFPEQQFYFNYDMSDHHFVLYGRKAQGAQSYNKVGCLQADETSKMAEERRPSIPAVV